MKGKFITVEGSDGPGKTSFITFATEYLKDKEIMKYLDVVVDGQFVQALHNPKLEWKGSSNQRVIDVKKTQEQGKVVLFDNYIH